MADAQNNQKNQQQDLNQILKVRREKLAALQEAGKDPFRHVKYDVTAHSKDIVEGFEELEGKTVSIAGRIMFKRVMGKASFCNVQDLKGSIWQRLSRSARRCSRLSLCIRAAQSARQTREAGSFVAAAVLSRTAALAAALGGSFIAEHVFILQ